VDLVAGAGRVIARVAEVVFDVAVARRLAREQRALELGDEHLVGLPEHVREDVQPPAMRHAEDDLVDAVVVGGGLDQRVQHRDERVGALEREPLRRRVLGGEERLEPLGHDEVLEHLAPLVGVEPRGVAAGLHLSCSQWRCSRFWMWAYSTANVRQ
jgi:hypothetical protein